MEHAFGPYMKQLREQQGYSINQLAEAAGISNSQISRIENGVRGVPKPANHPQDFRCTLGALYRDDEAGRLY